MDKKRKSGIFITIFAATMWGFSGTVTQYIFLNFNVNPGHLSTQRLLLSGLILVIAGFVKDKESMTKIWRKKINAVQILIFSITGMMMCQFSYMVAIKETNSGTATVIQYVGPVLIMITSCILTGRLPSKREVLAIILSVSGIFLIATNGNIHHMVITTAGLIWGLLSALALVITNMMPEKLICRFGSIPVTGYGMLIGGLSLAPFSRVWEAPLILSPDYILPFLSIIFIGTVIPFVLYLYGLSIIGPVKASMIASLEPVAAMVTMVIWLKEPLHPVSLVGSTLIILTIFILTMPSVKEKRAKKNKDSL